MTTWIPLATSFGGLDRSIEGGDLRFTEDGQIRELEGDRWVVPGTSTASWTRITASAETWQVE